MTTTVLKLTVPGKGVPRRLLDEIDKALVGYYARTWELHGERADWGHVWTMDIEVREDET